MAGQPRIGILGLGTMGGPMARRLAQSGFAVTGYDPSAKSAARAKADGVSLAASPLKVAEQSDLTLEEIILALRKRRIRTSLGALWRFFDRHDVTFKKSLRAAEQQRADVARARRRWIREQGMLDPARLVFIDETAVSTTWCGSTGGRHGASG